MALVKPPGEWGQQGGADIVCGEGQPLGIPLASGGPYFGFICCRKSLVRQLPGRLVGRTRDIAGRVAYTLTLQAREQHIRRSKATSNICTNQGLLVTAATIYLSVMGPQGLQKVAHNSFQNTHYLQQQLSRLPGVKVRFSAANFHECVLALAQPLAPIIAAMTKQGIHAGVALAEYYPELENCLLICVTETKSKQQLDRYVEVLSAACASNTTHS